MRERLTHLQVKGGKKREIEEMIESYPMQCEKEIEKGKREDVPKILQTKLDKEKRERQDKALAKVSSPAKSSVTAGPPQPVSTTSASTSTKAVAITKLKEEGSEQKWQKEKNIDSVEVVAIESDVESNSGLVIDEPPEEMLKQSTGTEQAMQSASADPSATLLATGLQPPMDVEQKEAEMETGEVG